MNGHILTIEMNCPVCKTNITIYYNINKTVDLYRAVRCIYCNGFLGIVNDFVWSESVE